MAWPPPLMSNPASTAARTAWPRSTPGIERPEPVPFSPNSAIANAGRPKRSFRRAATRPTTPGCQPSPLAITIDPFSSMPSEASASASACSSVAFSTCWRSRFRRSSSAAIAAAFAGSSAMRSFVPSVASPMRPPALMRGPSKKPKWNGVGGPSRRAASMSARRPTFSRRRSATRPLVTKARFKPTSGTTSATVPSATRSRKLRRSGSGRVAFQKPRSRSARTSATAVMNTSPTAAR